MAEPTAAAPYLALGVTLALSGLAACYKFAVMLTDLRAAITHLDGELSRQRAHLDGLAALTTKVDTMWAFQMRRAEMELTQRGLGERHSPLVVFAEAQAWLGDLAQELRGFYQRRGRQLADHALALAIEDEFGEAIVQRVCLPHGLTQGACLLIAIAVARQTAP